MKFNSPTIVRIRQSSSPFIRPEFLNIENQTDVLLSKKLTLKRLLSSLPTNALEVRPKFKLLNFLQNVQ